MIVKRDLVAWRGPYIDIFMFTDHKNNRIKNHFCRIQINEYVPHNYRADYGTVKFYIKLNTIPC